MTEDILEDAVVCHNCFEKFNQYDRFKTQADIFQAELIALFNSSLEDETKSVKEEHEEITEEVYYEHSVDIQEEPFSKYENFPEDQVETKVIGFDWINEQNEADILQRSLAVTNIEKPHTSKQFKARNQDLSAERKFQCEICHKTFKEKSKLKAHREIHNSERNVVCPVSAIL